MLKKIMVITIAFMLLFVTCVSAADSYGGYTIPVDIDINGSFIKCVHKPIISGSVTYIPLRAFSDAIGGTVEWNAYEMAATMKKNGHTFVFYPGKGYCLADGVRKNYGAIMQGNLTFIPVRVVSEVLGYNVLWDDFFLTVRITAPGVEVPAALRDSSYSYEDIMYLGKIIQVESGSQPFNTKLGVAGVIMNRVKSPKFPGNVKGVVFDTGYGIQFPPAHTDNFNSLTPSKESIIAAKCALNGVNTVGNSLYFIDVKSAPGSWAHNNRPYFGTINAMSFYE